MLIIYFHYQLQKLIQFVKYESTIFVIRLPHYYFFFNILPFPISWKIYYLQNVFLQIKYINNVIIGSGYNNQIVDLKVLKCIKIIIIY